MKKRRLNKSRILAALMSLCMIISLFNGIDLPGFFHNETIAQAADGGATPDTDDYKNETLEYVWTNGGVGGTDTTSFWNAARPYYACQGTASSTSFDQFGGVYKRTIFHVFAFAGDTICIGSSVKDSGLGTDNKLSTDCSTYTTSDADFNKQRIKILAMLM